MSQTLYREKSTFEIFAEVNTGLLNLYHVKFNNGYEVLIERQVEKGDGTSAFVLGLLLFVGILILSLVFYNLKSKYNLLYS